MPDHRYQETRTHESELYICALGQLQPTTFDSRVDAYEAALRAILRGDGGDPREWARRVLELYPYEPGLDGKTQDDIREEMLDELDTDDVAELFQHVIAKAVAAECPACNENVEFSVEDNTDVLVLLRNDRRYHANRAKKPNA